MRESSSPTARLDRRRSLENACFSGERRAGWACVESGQFSAALGLFELLEGFRHFAQAVVDAGEDAIPGKLAAGVG
jgi:hypothetical protein